MVLPLDTLVLVEVSARDAQYPPIFSLLQYKRRTLNDPTNGDTELKVSQLVDATTNILFDIVLVKHTLDSLDSFILYLV